MKEVFKDNGVYPYHFMYDTGLCEELKDVVLGKSKKAEAAPAVPHGRARRITVPNLFFGGRLPRFLGFDYTLEHLGSAATAAQGQLFKVAGRITSFAPSLRVICDLGRDDLHANIAGGASDRRFSPHYTSGFDDWLRGRYASFAP